jgi:hypothetical protein
LVDPTAAKVGFTLPRLATLRYQPEFSVAWDGASVSFYQHKQRKSYPSFFEMVTLVPPWLIFWMWIWTKMLMSLPFWLYRRLTAAQKKDRE